MTARYDILVRFTCGTHLAAAGGKRASSTSSPAVALSTLAAKLGPGPWKITPRRDLDKARGELGGNSWYTLEQVRPARTGRR